MAEESSQAWAKNILASHFRGLWSYAGCFDILEEIIHKYASHGRWPELWLSIKSTIRYDGESTRLRGLEQLTAPSDSYAEIEAYVFTDTWKHAEIISGDFIEKSKAIHEKIRRLGEHAVLVPSYLERLAPRLWEKHIDSLGAFGEGLAKGSLDQSLTFELLIRLLQAQKLKQVHPILFRGFINAIYADKPNLARQFQERMFEIPELKPHFVYLLGASPIAPWGIQKLIEIACTGELEAWRFEQLSYGRMHEPIPDSDLIQILSALIKLDGGIFSTLEILNMRFFIDRGNDYVPSSALLSIGQTTIRKLLSMHRNDISKHQLHGFNLVFSKCLSISAPDDEIREIIGVLCDSIENFRLYYFDIEEIIAAVVKNFPELVFNRVFTNNEKEEQLIHMLFKEGVSEKSSPLNLIPVDRLEKWCNSNRDKIEKVATMLSVYVPVSEEQNILGNPKQMMVSEHIKMLLDIADNKAFIIDVIADGIWPSAWCGSQADILEVRSRAFTELLEYPLSEVQEYVRAKLVLIEQSIQKCRVSEAEENSRREQRFE